jgi:transcriptional regulator with XRE-family HTH domain
MSCKTFGRDRITLRPGISQYLAPKHSSVPTKSSPGGSLFGERLRFVIWLAALRLGVESGKELAAAIGKRQGQLSSWIKEDPRPSFENIRLIAETVGISAAWLDNPEAAEAAGKEPELFAEWLAKRRARAKQRRRA